MIAQAALERQEKRAPRLKSISVCAEFANCHEHTGQPFVDARASFIEIPFGRRMN